MIDKRVDRALHAVPLTKLANLLAHQLRVESIGMVIVELSTLLQRQLIVRLVIVVVTEDYDILIDKGLLQTAHQGALARGSAARDAYDDRFVLHSFSEIVLWVYYK